MTPRGPLAVIEGDGSSDTEVRMTLVPYFIGSGFWGTTGDYILSWPCGSPTYDDVMLERGDSALSYRLVRKR